MTTFAKRTLTGIGYVVLLLGSFLLHPLTFVAFVTLVSGLATWEFCSNVNAHAGASVNRFITTCATLCLTLAMAGYVTECAHSRDFLPYLVTLLYLLVAELYRNEPYPLANWVYAFATQLYIALPMSMLFALAFRYDAMTNAVVYEWIYPLAVFLFLWTSDTGAYLCGSLLSRRFPAKLFPRISPKKSWVGSIGGGVLCLVVGALLGLFFPDKLPMTGWLGLAIVVCVFGTWGDLVESLFKRQLGVKDSGNILPGHGGILDRFDSALLAIPAATLYMLFWL